MNTIEAVGELLFAAKAYKHVTVSVDEKAAGEIRSSEPAARMDVSVWLGIDFSHPVFGARKDPNLVSRGREGTGGSIRITCSATRFGVLVTGREVASACQEAIRALRNWESEQTA